MSEHDKEHDVKDLDPKGDPKGGGPKPASGGGTSPPQPQPITQQS